MLILKVVSLSILGDISQPIAQTIGEDPVANGVVESSAVCVRVPIAVGSITVVGTVVCGG